MKEAISKKSNFIFVLILVSSIMGMLYFGNQKQGYHVDELYSYGLANSEYLPFLHFGESGYDVADWMQEYGSGDGIVDLCRNLWKDYLLLRETNFDFRSSEIYRAYQIAQVNSADTKTTTWVSGQDYVDYLTADGGSRFNPFSVYYNQRGDVHPPLFYLLLNFTSSLFPGRFSKWFGIANNMLYMIVTLLLLYRLARKHLGGEAQALLLCAVYGLSCACVSTVVFLRMYALLTLMVVACLKLHLDFMEADFELKSFRWKLFWSVLFGYLTHYYFVLFVIALCVVTSVLICLRKKWRTLFGYLFTMALTGACGIVVWPFSIKHVFGGYRGRETLSALGGSFYFIKVKVVWMYLCNATFGGWYLLPLILTILALLSCIVCKKWQRRSVEIYAMLYVPALVYLLLVPQIVPFLTDRYFMPLYPFLILMAVSSIFVLVHNVCSLSLAAAAAKHEGAITLLFGIGLILTNCFVLHSCGYLYTGGQETVKLPERTDCVYVLPDGSWNASSADLNVLAQCENVAIVYESNLEAIADYKYETGDTLMVTVQKELELEETVARVKEVCGAESLQEVERIPGTDCMRVLLQ